MSLVADTCEKEKRSVLKNLYQIQQTERTELIQAVAAKYTFAEPALDLKLLNRVLRCNGIKLSTKILVEYELYATIRIKLNDHLSSLCYARPPWYNFIFSKAVPAFCLYLRDDYRQHVRGVQKLAIQTISLSADIVNLTRSFVDVTPRLLDKKVLQWAKRQSAEKVGNEMFKYLMILLADAEAPATKKRKKTATLVESHQPVVKRIKWLGHSGNTIYNHTSIQLTFDSMAGLKLNFACPVTYRKIYDTISARHDFKTLKGENVMCDYLGNSFEDQLELIGDKMASSRQLILKMAPTVNQHMKVGYTINGYTNWTDLHDRGGLAEIDYASEIMVISDLRERIALELGKHKCPTTVEITIPRHSHFLFRSQQQELFTDVFDAWMLECQKRQLTAPDHMHETTLFVNIRKNMVVTGCCDLCRATVRAKGLAALETSREGHLIFNARTEQLFCL